MKADVAWQDGDPCELCGEEEEFDDIIAMFWSDERHKAVMCHGQCGVDEGLRIA